MQHYDFSQNIADKLKRYSTLAPSGCIEWTAGKDTGGYGRIYISAVAHPAHRVAYEFAKGAIPEGLHIDHLCKNRKCINPDHLEAVTQAENTRRGCEKEFCIRGHRMEPSNCHYPKEGGRRCLACVRMRSPTRQRGRPWGTKFINGKLVYPHATASTDSSSPDSCEGDSPSSSSIALK